MFTSEHQLWHFANYGDELDDWLLYAEDLVKQWSIEKDVVFKDTFQIIIASYLLMDDLLPSSARISFSQLMLDTISESIDKKIAMKQLMINKPNRGRKKRSRADEFIILHDVCTYLKQGSSKTNAYSLVSKKHFKSPDTIRRMFERATKKKPR